MAKEMRYEVGLEGRTEFLHGECREGRVSGGPVILGTDSKNGRFMVAFKSLKRLGEMAHLVMAPTNQPDDLGSIPGICMVKERNGSSQLSSDIYICAIVNTLPSH